MTDSLANVGGRYESDYSRTEREQRYQFHRSAVGFEAPHVRWTPLSITAVAHCAIRQLLHKCRHPWCAAAPNNSLGHAICDDDVEGGHFVSR